MRLRRLNKNVCFSVFVLLLFMWHSVAMSSRAYNQDDVSKVVAGNSKCRTELLRTSEVLSRLIQNCDLSPLERLPKTIAQPLFKQVLEINMGSLLTDVVSHAIERCHIVDCHNRAADDSALAERAKGTLVEPKTMERIRKAGTVSGVLINENRKLDVAGKCAGFLKLIAKTNKVTLGETSIDFQKKRLHVSFCLEIPNVICDVFTKERGLQCDLPLDQMLFFMDFDLNSFFVEEEEEREPEGGSMFPIVKII